MDGVFRFMMPVNQGFVSECLSVCASIERDQRTSICVYY